MRQEQSMPGVMAAKAVDGGALVSCHHKRQWVGVRQCCSRGSGERWCVEGEGLRLVRPVANEASSQGEE